MNTTVNPHLLEPPRTVIEQFGMMVLVLLSTYLFLCRISEKKSLIWQVFPQFCLLMTFIPITHFSFLITHTFQKYIFTIGASHEVIFRRLVPIIIFCYPALYIPPIPSSITMIYSIFLNCKVEDSAKLVFGLKPTYNKITVFVISMSSAIYFLRIKRNERCFVYSIHLDSYHRFDFDMLRYIPILIITLYFLRRIFHYKNSSWPVRVSQAEFLYLVYVALFTFVFWLITIPQFLVTLLSYHYDLPSRPTRLLGFQDSCVLQYTFIYAVSLARSKMVTKVFKMANVYPRRF